MNIYPTKTSRILAYLANGKSLNRFEAQNLNDTALNSTISSLVNSYGVNIASKFEAVPCLGSSKKTRVKRYWINSENLSQAKEVLARMLKKKGGKNDA